MADAAAAIKKDIKLWERSFRANNGRDPTVSDIKMLPAIAEKYKLYKRLSKQNHPQPVPSASTLSPSSELTSPNSGRSRSSVISHPREVRQAAPLYSYNPFSPRKKQGTTQSADNPSKQGRPHLFSPKSTHLPRSPSPNPFSATNAEPSSIPFPVTPVKDTAMSRARKRLRGERVSPTPNKDKKRRVESHAGLVTLSVNLNDTESDEDHMEEDISSRVAFVDDSPVKGVALGRSFKQLFDDKIRAPPLYEGSGTRSDLPPRLSKHDTSDVSRTGHSENYDIPHVLNSSNKLIPPSPPEVSGQRRNPNESSRSKSGLNFNDSLSGMDKDEHSDTSGDAHIGHIKVKVLDLKNIRRPRQLKASSDDEGLPAVKPEIHLGYDAPRGSHNGSISSQYMRSDRSEDNLSNTLRHNLVLQPESATNQEEKIVRSLLSGSRVLHYDPIRGGEIWNAGENEHEEEEFTHPSDVRDADDWEDEPIPWDVGEL